jgi:hypothetical protein
VICYTRLYFYYSVIGLVHIGLDIGVGLKAHGANINWAFVLNMKAKVSEKRLTALIASFAGNAVILLGIIGSDNPELTC